MGWQLQGRLAPAGWQLVSANDSTSNGNNGSNAGATATSGEIDGGAGFTGSGLINVNNSSSLGVTSGDLTVSVWIFANAYSSYSTVFDKGTAASRDYSFWINGSNNGWWAIGTNHGPWNASGFTAGAWHYLVVERSGGTSQIFLDGNPAYSTTGFSGTTDSGGNLNLSGNPSGGGSLWNGKLDEFRVSNTARLADWVTTEYNNQNSPATFYSVGPAQ